MNSFKEIFWKRALLGLIFIVLCFYWCNPVPASDKILKALKSRVTADDDVSLLVFASDRTGNWEIWTADLDGSNQRIITKSDGSKADPALSPDGKQVVFVNQADDRWELQVASLDDPEETRTLTALTGYIRNPSWSSDGQRIVFSFSTEEEPFHPNAIYEVNPFTTKVTTLLKIKEGNESALTWFLNYPVLTPDERFLYHTRAEIPTPGFPKYSAVAIYRTDLNNEKTTAIVGGPFYYDEGGTLHGHWATSPDLCGLDQRMVFVAVVGYTEGALCFSSLDGQQVRRILRQEGTMYRNPTVTSDGRYIYYESLVEEQTHLFRFDAVRGDSIQITTNGNNRTPDL